MGMLVQRKVLRVIKRTLKSDNGAADIGKIVNDSITEEMRMGQRVR